MGRKHSIFFIALGLAVMFTASLAHGLERSETLDRGLRSNGAYANALVIKSESAEPAERAALLRQAIKHSPDSPTLYFRLAAATMPNLGMAATYLVDGIKVYGHSFWWQMSIKGLLYISALLAVLISAGLIALIRLPKALPRLVHDINESKAKIIIPFLMVPAAFLGPVVLIGALMMLSGLYMKRGDKWVVYLTFILIAAVPFLGKTADSFYSASTPEAMAIVAVNEGRDNVAALQALKGKNGFAREFSYATALKREGRLGEAISMFEALAGKGSDPRVFINLGNAYFAQGNSDAAKEAYKKAMGMDRSVLALYNLSQAYRDSFEYAEGDKYYEEAQAMDRAAISGFQEIHGKSYNRTVIDARLTIGEMGSVALDARLRALPLAGDYMRTFYGGAALFVIFALLDSIVGVRSYRCAKCDALACDMCSDPRQTQSDLLCMDCLKAQGANEDTSAKERVSRMLAANEEKSRVITRLRILSVMPPGLAQAYSGRVGKAFFYMMFFLFPVIVLALNPYFHTGLDGGSHGWLWPVAVPLLALVYLVSIITVNRRLDRGWL